MAGSIGQYSSQVTATQLEQVRKRFANLLTLNTSELMKKFDNKTEKHQVSAWNAGSPNVVQAWRIPVLVSVGGDYQAVSLDSGSLGGGSMMNTAYMFVGYFASDLAYGIPSLAMMATQTQTQAMSNTLKFQIGQAFKEIAIYNEIGFFQDSTGVLATANGTGSPAIAGGKVTYNLETAFSFNRLRGANALVDVYDSSNVQQQLGSRVSSVNFSLTAPTVTLTVGSGSTVANTDQIAFAGMGGTVGTSTITTGSWRNGLYTFSTTNTSGSILGLAYSSVYELQCCQVNGNSGYYTPSVIYSGAAQLRQRRDDQAVSGAIGICAMAQRVSWYLQGVTIANQYLRPGEAAKSVDLAGQGLNLNEPFMAGDIMHHVSRYSSKTRVDIVIPANYGYVQLDEIDFYRSPEGQRYFIGHNTTTGQPIAAFNFYVLNTRNLYNVDPGANVINYGLSIPAGQ